MPRIKPPKNLEYYSKRTQSRIFHQIAYNSGEEESSERSNGISCDELECEELHQISHVSKYIQHLSSMINVQE